MTSSATGNTITGTTRTVLTIAVLGAALITAWLVALDTPIPASNHATQTDGSGILDGREFAGKVGIVGKPLDTADTWNFSKGTFVSTQCETQCRYPRVPYYIRQYDGAVEFIGETRCLDKDATISWHGKVKGDTIEGTFTWNINRWYWNIEKKFWFEGSLTSQANAAVLD